MLFQTLFLLCCLLCANAFCESPCCGSPDIELPKHLGETAVKYKKDVMEHWKEKYAEFIGERQVPDITKKFLIRVGVMGAGKSSAVDNYIDAHSSEFGVADGNAFPLIDLDGMVMTAPEYYRLTCDGKRRRAPGGADPWWEGQKEIDGYAIKTELTVAARQKGQTFSSESTGKNIYNVKGLKKLIVDGNCKSDDGETNVAGCFYPGDLKAKDYEVFAVSPFVPYYDLKKRLDERTRRTGRAVPFKEVTENIEAYYPNVKGLMEDVDFHLVSNQVAQGENPVLMAKSVGGVQCRTNVVEQTEKNINEQADEYADVPEVLEAEINLINDLKQITKICKEKQD